MGNFDGIADPQQRREAQLFVAALTAGANVGSVIMHALVVKGIFTKAAAISLLEDARRSSLHVDVPKGYENAVDTLYKQLKEGFR